MSEIYKALSKAQSKMKGAVKDSTNPHFRSRYADLESVIDALKAPFAEGGLSYYQSVSEDGQRLVTTIAHESGETISGSVPLIIGKQDMQGVGSAITYARRYGLAALAGVSQTDDDGNAACESPKPAVPAPAAKAAQQFKAAIAFERPSEKEKAASEAEMILAHEKKQRDAEKPADVFEDVECYQYEKHGKLVGLAAKELGIATASLKAHKDELNAFLAINAYGTVTSIKSAIDTYFAKQGEKQ